MPEQVAKVWHRYGTDRVEKRDAKGGSVTKKRSSYVYNHLIIT